MHERQMQDGAQQEQSFSQIRPGSGDPVDILNRR
jgi:hypothetical protein